VIAIPVTPPDPCPECRREFGEHRFECLLRPSWEERHEEMRSRAPSVCVYCGAASGGQDPATGEEVPYHSKCPKAPPDLPSWELVWDPRLRETTVHLTAWRRGDETPEQEEWWASEVERRNALDVTNCRRVLARFEAPDEAAATEMGRDMLMRRVGRSYVYLVTESGIEHHEVVAVHASEQDALAEVDYCRDKQLRHEADDDKHFDIDEFEVGRSRAHLLVRATADLRVTEVSFDAGTIPMPHGLIRRYDQVHADGECWDVIARTVGEGVAMLAAEKERAGAPQAPEVATPEEVNGAEHGPTGSGDPNAG
jgi:hypothetical protein